MHGVDSDSPNHNNIFFDVLTVVLGIYLFLWLKYCGANMQVATSTYQQIVLKEERRLFWPLKMSKVELVCQGIDMRTGTSPPMVSKIFSQTGRQERSPAAWSMVHH
jgi:hypothetical protein